MKCIFLSLIILNETMNPDFGWIVRKLNYTLQIVMKSYNFLRSNTLNYTAIKHFMLHLGEIQYDCTIEHIMHTVIE